MKSRTDTAFSFPSYPRMPEPRASDLSDDARVPQFRQAHDLMEAGLPDAEIAARLGIAQARISALRRYYGLHRN